MGSLMLGMPLISATLSGARIVVLTNEVGNAWGK